MKFLLSDSPAIPPRSSLEGKTKSPIPGSASIQSHSSNIVSRTRLRNPSVVVDLQEDTSGTKSDLEANDAIPAWTSLSGQHWITSALSLESHTIGLRPGRLRGFKWFLVIYSLFSVALFTNTLWISLGSLTLAVTRRGTEDIHTVPESYMQSLPYENLLSKITSIHADVTKLSPFVMNAMEITPDLVTACLWTRDFDLELVHPWISRWTGPISLVITTDTTPRSPAYHALMRNISAIQVSSTLRRSLSIHLLQVKPFAPPNPNAYLNIARMFARTPRVVLFPGNISYVPPKPFYKTFFATTLHLQNITKPTIFTSRLHATYPFSGLSPIVLNRDDPVWCTERFFAATSREADWGECLWQIWLEHFGDLDVKQTSEWVQPFIPAFDRTASTPAAKVHRRLAAKFRSESCMLATRQLAALKTREKGGADAKKARWLKRHCREWMTLA